MNDVCWRLLTVASAHDINVQWSGRLSPYTPPACRIDTRIVLMNLNWHRSHELTFQLAHEMAHIINGDPEDTFFYHATFTGKRSVEYKANVGAVGLLVPFYCEETEPEDANVVHFTEAYAVPEFMAPVVKEKIVAYYVR